jgi:hypothetical protein
LDLLRLNRHIPIRLWWLSVQEAGYYYNYGAGYHYNHVPVCHIHRLVPTCVSRRTRHPVLKGSSRAGDAVIEVLCSPQIEPARSDNSSLRVSSHAPSCADGFVTRRRRSNRGPLQPPHTLTRVRRLQHHGYHTVALVTLSRIMNQ